MYSFVRARDSSFRIFCPAMTILPFMSNATNRIITGNYRFCINTSLNQSLLPCKCSYEYDLFGQIIWRACTKMELHKFHISKERIISYNKVLHNKAHFCMYEIELQTLCIIRYFFKNLKKFRMQLLLHSGRFCCNL